MSFPSWIVVFLYPLLFSNAFAEPKKPAPPPPQPAAVPAPSAPVTPPADNAPAKPFEFSDVEQKAKDLARKPYVRDESGMPEFLTGL